MKPGKRDIKVKMLITDEELAELKRHLVSMVESYGLDSRIEKYKGQRPIGLYRWDMDCLIDVVDIALDDHEEYPDRTSSGYLALKKLYDRLVSEYNKNFPV
jgi:hypothetical protein